MYKEYTQEEFWKLYKDLPLNLKDTLSTEETGNNVEKACQRNEEEGGFSKALNLVGQVLLGLLPPEEFEKTIMEDLSVDEEKAKKISREISRLVFFPVREELSSLYGTEKAVSEGEEISREGKASKDTYREPIE